MAGWKFDDILSDFQGAMLDTCSWRKVLAKLNAEIGGAGIVLISSESRYQQPFCSPDIDELVHRYCHDGWHERDLRYRGVEMMERRGIMTDLDCIDPDRMNKSDYYETFLASQGRRWFAGVGFRAGENLWTLSIQRSSFAGPFAPDELHRLLYLWRPFTDAATVGKLLGEIRTLSTIDALDVVSCAAIICDREGRVMRMNSAAELFVGDGAATGRRIVFRHAPSAVRFEALLDSACVNALAPVATPRAIQVLNNRGEQIFIRAICLAEDIRCIFADSPILLLLRPKEPTIQEHLHEHFGLTSAEIAVAVALFQGMSPKRIADDRFIKVDTVRAHLKSIFFKTDTGTQAQLVALIGRFFAAQVQK